MPSLLRRLHEPSLLVAFLFFFFYVSFISTGSFSLINLSIRQRWHQSRSHPFFFFLGWNEKVFFVSRFRLFHSPASAPCNHFRWWNLTEMKCWLKPLNFEGERKLPELCVRFRRGWLHYGPESIEGVWLILKSRGVQFHQSFVLQLVNR